MTRCPRLRRLALTLMLAQVAFPAPVWAEAQTGTGSSSAALPAEQVPLPASTNLDRIRELASRPSTIRIDDGQLRIYVEVIARWPRFDEIAKDYDLMSGPTRRGNPMTHQEFLNMVTPKELYSTAGIMPTDMLQMALTGWLIKAVIEKGLEDIKKAKTQGEIDEIRARIDRELAAIKGGK
jgi:hypothetical protein